MFVIQNELFLITLICLNDVICDIIYAMFMKIFIIYLFVFNVQTNQYKIKLKQV